MHGEPPKQVLQKAKSRGRRPVVIGLIVIALAAGLVYYLTGTPQQPRRGRFGAETGPVPVLVAPAKAADVPVYLDAVGTIKALNTVTVSPQVDGKLLSVGFKEGEEVKKGAVLARIDPTIYQAQLDQAIAKKAQDQALLGNAKNDLTRYETLAATNAINRQQADTQRALVAQYTAQVQSDQAAIENAQATLGYTTIVAPIDGRTGIRMVDEGNIVHASSSPGIVVITQIKPISAIFNLPQQNIDQVNSAFAKGPLPVDALRSDTDAVIGRGKLTVLDNQVDQSTGTVKLKAEFPNADEQLWPGQFVNVRLLIDTLKQVVVIPTGAVQRGPSGTFVYVVGDDNVAKIQPVTVTKQDETQSVIGKGVTPPERVVTTGFARLTDGAKVTIGSSEGATAVAPQSARSRSRTRGAGGGSQRPSGGGTTKPNPATMSVSSPFIQRPIATSLLGVAVMLGGALGYWWLPVSALPQVDFPTIQVTTQLPGANPDTIAVAGDRAAGAPVRANPGARRNDLVELVRHQPGHAAIRSVPRHRRRGAGRAVGDQRRGLDAAAQPPLSAALFQGEPGRHADHHAGADLGYRRPARLERHGRQHHGAAAVRTDRRRPCLGGGRHPPGDPHPGRPVAARRLRHRPGGPAHGDRLRQRRRRQGLARRRAPVLHHRRQRPDRLRRGLQVGDRRLPQRRAGAARRRRRCGQRPGEHQGRRLVPRPGQPS